VKQIRANKTPLRAQVQQHLFDLIRDDTFPPGRQLPSEADLSAQLGVSRPTLREALTRLEQEGMILRKQGVGTFVSSHTPVMESGLEVLESLDRQAQRNRLSIDVTHLNALERPATPEELEMLLLSRDETIDILSVDRVITLEGKSVAYLKDVVPKIYLRRSDLKERFTSSVLDIFLQRGTPLPATSRTEIEAVKAESHMASRLGIQRGTALLKLTGQLYSLDEKVLDYSVSYFIPGYFKFHLTRRVATG